MVNNPQLENGHVKIANEIVDALVCFNDLNWSEARLLLLVIRMTYGFNKKEDWISYTQFEKKLKMSRSTVFRSITSLVAKSLLVANRQLGQTFYGLNKHYSEWVVAKPQLGSCETATSCEVGTKVVANLKQSSCEVGTKVVANSQPTKDILQKTITKDTSTKDSTEFPKTETPAQKARIFFENENFEPYRTKLLESGANETIVDQELKKFWAYWTEPNKSGTKKRWELQPVFDIPRRLSTWFSRVGNGSSFGKSGRGKTFGHVSV